MEQKIICIIALVGIVLSIVLMFIAPRPKKEGNISYKNQIDGYKDTIKILCTFVILFICVLIATMWLMHVE